MPWRTWPVQFVPAISKCSRRLGSRAGSMTVRPVSEDAKQRAPVLRLALDVLSTRRGVLLPGSISTGGVIVLSPSLGRPEIVVWRRGVRCRVR